MGFAWSFIVGGTVCAKNVWLRIVSELSVKRGEGRGERFGMGGNMGADDSAL